MPVPCWQRVSIPGKERSTRLQMGAVSCFGGPEAYSIWRATFKKTSIKLQTQN